MSFDDYQPRLGPLDYRMICDKDADDRAVVARAGCLIRDARHAVALTGAGLSTRSGIPDFRSPGSGLWEEHDPMAVASIYSFRRNPQRFYDWIRPLARRIGDAEPNDAHRALAALEAGGWLKAVITQNVDGLHQRAGTQLVLELHGHAREWTCTACRLVLPGEKRLQDHLYAGQVPRCPECAGVLRPNVVLIGEQLPKDVVDRSLAHLSRADVLLVAGSSLEMAPASELPQIVLQHGGHLVVVNIMPTHVDGLATVVIRGDVTDALPRIAEACAQAPAGQ